MQPAMAEAHLRQEEPWAAAELTPSRAQEGHPARQGWVAQEAPLPAIEEDSARLEREDSPVPGPSALREWAVDSALLEAASHRVAVDSALLEVASHRAAVDSVLLEVASHRGAAGADLEVTAADSRHREADLAVDSAVTAAVVAADSAATVAAVVAAIAAN